MSSRLIHTSTTVSQDKCNGSSNDNDDSSVTHYTTWSPFDHSYPQLLVCRSNTSIFLTRNEKLFPLTGITLQSNSYLLPSNSTQRISFNSPQFEYVTSSVSIAILHSLFLPYDYKLILFSPQVFGDHTFNVEASRTNTAVSLAKMVGW